MMVAFRVDASASIGLGHLKRCSVLAKALDGLGVNCCFAWRDLGFDCAERIEAEGYESVGMALPGADVVVDWEEDAKAFVTAMAGRGVERVVVDHYALDRGWHDRVAQELGCEIVVIDDLANRPIGGTIVIDQNFHESHAAKYAGLLPRGTKMLGGPGFALLGSEYQSAPRYSHSDEVRSIGVFMGGSDPENSSCAVLDAIESINFAGAVEIVSTEANPHLASLRARCAARPGTELVVNLPSLSGFFARHDIQIGAGGSASWERLCIGAPSILLGFAENHDQVLLPLAELDVAQILLREWAVADLASELRTIIAAPDKRRRFSENGRAIVDGFGSRRVAIALSSSMLALRPATWTDSDIARAWRDHHSVRKASRQQDPISLEAHKQWFERTLTGEERQLFVGEIGGHPVGFIRLDRSDGGSFEISFYVDPALDGLGLGMRLLSAVEAMVPFGATIFGEVLPDNLKSGHLFKKLGYVNVSRGRWEKPAGQFSERRSAG